MATMTGATLTSTGFRPRLWVPGDWNALFGFGTNILVNVLVLTGLLRFVLRCRMPWCSAASCRPSG